MKLLTKSAGLALALACVSLPSWADKYSTSNILNTRLEVIDLTPNDGVSAGVSFFNILDSTYTHLLSNSGAFPYENTFLQNAHEFTPNFNIDMMGNDHATSIGFGTGYADIGASGRVETSGSYNAYRYVAADFVLAPNTQLVFHGTVVANATSWGTVEDGVRSSSAYTSFSVSGGKRGEPGIAYVSAISGGSRGTNYQAQDFVFSITNEGNNAPNGRFVASTWASGNELMVIPNPDPGGGTQPIPEPETYAMLLAGLGLTGFIARRRKVKA